MIQVLSASVDLCSNGNKSQRIFSRFCLPWIAFKSFQQKLEFMRKRISSQRNAKKRTNSDTDKTHDFKMIFESQFIDSHLCQCNSNVLVDLYLHLCALQTCIDETLCQKSCRTPIKPNKKYFKYYFRHKRI